VLHAVRHHKLVHPWTATSDLTIAERVDRCITLHEGRSRAALAGKPGDRVRVCQSPVGQCESCWGRCEAFLR